MKRASTRYVTKANSLIEASYKLTLAEQRLLLLVISRIDSRVAAVSADTRFAVHAKDLAEAFQVSQKEAYDSLKDAAERLFHRYVLIDRPDPDDPSITCTKTRWVSAISYAPHQGRIDLFLSPKVIPYLTLLSREFTSYRLPNVAKLTSSYALRLYEMLIQWKARGALEIEVETLKARFVVPDNYQRIYDLKRFVIEPAVTQINTHSDLWVKWTQRKEGRHVVALLFTFGEKAPAPPKSVTRSSEEVRQWIEQHARPGESWEQARERLMREETRAHPANAG
jgi:plasmid replication initiation protein